MREKDAKRLFDQASTLGYRYGIDLMGAESIVPMAGPSGGLDTRVSDSEHVIHELAHCVTLGVPFEPEPEQELMARLGKRMSLLSSEEQLANEIETFSVTMEVLRRRGATVNEDDFKEALSVQVDGVGRSNRPSWDPVERMRTFHTTGRGTQAVEKILNLLESAQ